MGNQNKSSANNHISQYYDQFGKFISDNADYTEILQDETYKVKKRSNLTSATNSKAISSISLEIFSELLLANKTALNSVYHPLTVIKLNSNESGIDFIEYQNDNLNRMLQKFEHSVKTKMQNIEQHWSSIEKDEKESSNKDESKKEINILSKNEENWINYTGNQFNWRVGAKKDSNADMDKMNDQKSMISFLGQTKNEKKNDLNYNSMINILNKIDKIDNEPKYSGKLNSSQQDNWTKTSKKGEITSINGMKSKFGLGFMKKGSSKTEIVNVMWKGQNGNPPWEIKRYSNDISSQNRAKESERSEAQFNQFINKAVLDLPVITFEVNDTCSVKNIENTYNNKQNQWGTTKNKNTINNGPHTHNKHWSHYNFDVKVVRTTQSNYRNINKIHNQKSTNTTNVRHLCKKYYKLPKEIEEEEIIKTYCKPRKRNVYSINIDLRKIPDDWDYQWNDSSNIFWNGNVNTNNNNISMKIDSVPRNESGNTGYTLPNNNKKVQKHHKINSGGTQKTESTITNKTQYKQRDSFKGKGGDKTKKASKILLKCNSDEINNSITNNRSINNKNGVIRRMSTPEFEIKPQMSTSNLPNLSKNNKDLPSNSKFNSPRNKEGTQQNNNEWNTERTKENVNQENLEWFNECVNKNNSVKMKFEKPDYNKKNPKDWDIFKEWNEQKNKNKFLFSQTDEEKKLDENINWYHKQKHGKTHK